jgi:hypothetical protein
VTNLGKLPIVTKARVPKIFPRFGGSQKESSAETPWHSGRRKFPKLPLCAVGPYPGLYRSSSVRAVIQEIRTLPFRIRELLRDQLHRRGVSIHPLAEMRASSEEHQSAIDGCKQDMRNLYERRPHTTLIESRLFAEAWAMGAAWSRCTLHKEPGACT